MLVHKEVVEGGTITNNLCHAVCDHRDCRVWVQLDVWVSQVVLIESVDKNEFLRNFSHSADCEESSGVLIEVISINSQ